MLSEIKSRYAKKKYFIFEIICILFFASCLIFSQQESSKIRIGAFDSRCIAVAYATGGFKEDMDSIRTERDKAKEEDKKIVRLDFNSLLQKSGGKL
jgi:hypothetical protein